MSYNFKVPIRRCYFCSEPFSRLLEENECESCKHLFCYECFEKHSQQLALFNRRWDPFGRVALERKTD